MRPRKVNAPASLRRRREGAKRLKDVAGPSSYGLERGAKKVVALAVAVTVLLVGLVGLLDYLSRQEPKMERPWENYAARMKVDRDLSQRAGREVYVYRYRPGEVDLWVAGAGSRSLEMGELRKLCEKAVELLRPRDAVAVLDAAAQGNEEGREQVLGLARVLLARVEGAGAEERWMRQRLEAILRGPGEEANQ